MKTYELLAALALFVTFINHAHVIHSTYSEELGIDKNAVIGFRTLTVYSI
jgi:hypothetical protein